jgi:hypothetical protein
VDPSKYGIALLAQRKVLLGTLLAPEVTNAK